MQRADIHTVAHLLGHVDLRMTARSQQLSPTSLADAVDRLDAISRLLHYPDVIEAQALRETSHKKKVECRNETLYIG